ncbi:MAG: hypothetical protein HY900_08855, partial [Deltaproteobacteria bacterium]|nr:hypothetical protein [Deltaproteobacteria bacterium]
MRVLRLETGLRALVAMGASAALAALAAPDAGSRRVVMAGLPTAYVEKVPAAKSEILRIINQERAAAGAPPLAYDLLGAKVGDEFCEDAARKRTSGHWDQAGRPPYLRWALAGGIDYHAQNFASESRQGFEFTEAPVELLMKTHAAFMSEKPPNDGHRKTVLDPIWTHVGIGFSIVGGEMRVTEEFSRRVLEWVELPPGPVKAGKEALVVLKLPRTWKVGAVEVAYEELPKPMSRPEIAARRSYGLPPTWQTYRPYPPAGTRWSSGEEGDFRQSAAGRIELTVPLLRGPGHYYLVVFASQSEAPGRKVFPVA